jgi:enoyl-[acyl-carrier protein] reductase I
MASRAANAIGRIQDSIEHCRAVSPLPEAISAAEVANAAAFLACQLATGITGTTLYVDKRYHAMGMASITSPTCRTV